ncbi:peptide/nickel transport system permease protein [Nocardioides thalensis]|uniref:Peptide/nickel transport system permease protein n=1 Tax=Nocardioides thalensis TaxID=1914755 RepID=A0A853C482_9ACTN|nr:ABC transporter permease [Nocardioides thalensis]NYJ01368.1 peptide/nickel transport system permease protein [Nocardioides thalensis]
MTRSGSGSLPRYILQRVLLVIPMIWVILTLVFVVLRVAPGDPVSAAMGGKLNDEALDQRREALGFNEPLLAQYWDYLSSVARFDFGTTFSDNQQVLHVVRDNGGATLSLTIVSFLIALLIGIPLGMIAGRYRDSVPDAFIRLFGILTYAAPIFFVGFLLQAYVAGPLGLPTSGMASPITVFSVEPKTHILLIDVFLSGDGAAIEDVLKHLILPSITLGLLICGVFIRLVRVNILQTMHADYVEAAEARGISRGKVTRRHAFRNALVPVITVVGLQFALLLGGAVLTESTFNWPGLGEKLVDYINDRDYGAVQGIITIFAIAVVLISLLVDIVNALIDPRVRY